MKVNLTISILLIVFLSTACSKRTICPAYQSSFMFDGAKRDQFFSAFVQDTLPKEDFEVIKDNRGLVASVSYRGKKRTDLNGRIEMITIYPEPPMDGLDSLVVMGADSTGNYNPNPVARKPRKKPGYNRDQQIYMDLFGEYYYEQTSPPEAKEEEEEKLPWYKRLFRKKKSDEEQQEPGEEEQEGPQDEEQNPTRDASGKLEEDVAKN